jgi:hypothetical protein
MDARERLKRNRARTITLRQASPRQSTTPLRECYWESGKLAGLSAAFGISNESHAHWSRWSVSSTNRRRSSVGRVEMTDKLRRQLREVEQALVTLEGVIAVRREHISLLQRLGSRDKELASLDALMTARSRLQSQRDCLAAAIASGAR